MGCGAGNGSVLPTSQTKQAAQANGRAVAGQQWQPPHNPPAPPTKPTPHDLPAAETVKMSSELRVGSFPLPQCWRLPVGELTPSAVFLMCQLSSLASCCMGKQQSVIPMLAPDCLLKHVGLLMACETDVRQQVVWQVNGTSLIISSLLFGAGVGFTADQKPLQGPH